MRTSGPAALLTIAVVLAAGAARADDRDAALAATLRSVVEGGAAHCGKDVEQTMASIDSRSPGYDRTRNALARQFARGTTSKLVDFRYIGHDDEFAVARVKYATTATPGTPFVDNAMDTMTIFHQEDGRWKIWDQLVLGVETPPRR